MPRLIRFTAFTCALLAVELGAQASPPSSTPHVPGMQHTPGMQHEGSPAKPVQGGQAAFAAVREIVALLEADSNTNWLKVDLEALRQHLIDMDAVTLRARVRTAETTGGLVMDVTGEPSVVASARRMLGAHAPMLEALGGWRATAVPTARGVRLTVVASNMSDTSTIARIRGLGLIGLMTQGAHHAEHHLAIARGDGAHSHGTP